MIFLPLIVPFILLQIIAVTIVHIFIASMSPLSVYVCVCLSVICLSALVCYGGQSTICWSQFLEASPLRRRHCTQTLLANPFTLKILPPGLVASPITPETSHPDLVASPLYPWRHLLSTQTWWQALLPMETSP